LNRLWRSLGLALGLTAVLFAVRGVGAKAIPK
jgi:hypothetical protein